MVRILRSIWAHVVSGGLGSGVCGTQTVKDQKQHFELALALNGYSAAGCVSSPVIFS